MFTPGGGGINPNSLQTLAASTALALQGIATQVQTRWFKQHDHNGAHKDVTATSIVLASLLKANGRMSIGTPLHINRPLEAETMPFYLGVDNRQTVFQGTYGRKATEASFLRITTSSFDPDPLVWHGLDATGREEGDLVVFLNDGNTIVEFVSQSTSTPLNSQFFSNSFLPSGNYELGSGGLGIAVYSTNSFLGAKFWHWLQMG